MEPYTDFLNALNLKIFFTKLLLNIDITRRKVSYKFEFECIDTINTNAVSIESHVQMDAKIIQKHDSFEMQDSIAAEDDMVHEAQSADDPEHVELEDDDTNSSHVHANIMRFNALDLLNKTDSLANDPDFQRVVRKHNKRRKEKR